MTRSPRKKAGRREAERPHHLHKQKIDVGGRAGAWRLVREKGAQRGRTYLHTRAPRRIGEGEGEKRNRRLAWSEEHVTAGEGPKTEGGVKRNGGVRKTPRNNEKTRRWKERRGPQVGPPAPL